MGPWSPLGPGRFSSPLTQVSQSHQWIACLGHQVHDCAALSGAVASDGKLNS